MVAATLLAGYAWCWSEDTSWRVWAADGGIWASVLGVWWYGFITSLSRPRPRNDGVFENMP